MRNDGISDKGFDETVYKEYKTVNVRLNYKSMKTNTTSNIILHQYLSIGLQLQRIAVFFCTKLEQLFQELVARNNYSEWKYSVT